MNINAWTTLIAGAYLIFICFLFKASGFWATLLIKFLPFMLGLCCILLGLNLLNVIQIKV